MLPARLRLVVAAILFSTGGAAIKATTLTAWQVAGFRSGVAALAVWLLVPAARRRWSPRVLVVGVCYAATMVTFVVANKLTTAANAIFLQATAPLYVLLAGPLLLGERSRLRDVGFIAAIAGGMLLCFLDPAAPRATAPDPARGNLIGAASGMLWASTLLGLRWLETGGRRAADAAPPKEAAGSALVTVVVGNALACLVCLPLALPAAGATTVDWAVVGYLGVFQIGLAYLALTSAMPHVPALEASTLLLVEPALNPIWALLVHDERPGPLAWVGGAVILLAAIGRTWWEGRPAAVRRVAD